MDKYERAASGFKRMAEAFARIKDRVVEFIHDVLDKINGRHKRELKMEDIQLIATERAEAGSQSARQSVMAREAAQRKRRSQPYYKNVSRNAKPWE